LVNGRAWRRFDAESVFLPDSPETPDVVRVSIALGSAKPKDFTPAALPHRGGAGHGTRWAAFLDKLERSGLGGGYEAAHAQLVVDSYAAAERRGDSGKPVDKLYADTAAKLAEGLETVLKGYANSPDNRKARIAELFR
jgi:hypothetical protein